MRLSLDYFRKISVISFQLYGGGGYGKFLIGKSIQAFKPLKFLQNILFDRCRNGLLFIVPLNPINFVVNNLKHFKLFSFLMLCGFTQAQTIEECDKIFVEAISEMNQKNHTRSLELLTEVKTMAINNAWQKQLFLAFNNLGANYYLMLDYGEALDNYLEAYKIALKGLDAKYEMSVLNNIAILYSKEQKFEKAEEYFLKAYHIAKKNQDSLKIGLYATNLATVASQKSEIEKADQYIKIAIPLLKNVPPILDQAKITYVHTLILKKDFDEAKRIALQLLTTLNTPELSEHRISLLMNISDIYKYEGNQKLAIDYAMRAGNDSNSNIENKIDVYNQLSELYRTENKSSLAFIYKDSVIWAKDSLNQIKNGRLFENSRVKFELQNYEKELRESQKILKAERNLFYSIIGGIILLILISFWAIWNYSVKLRQRKIISERNYKIAGLEVEKQKKDKILLIQHLREMEVLNLFKQEKLKSEIDSKNRELTSKVVSISTRNELIENIIDSLTNSAEISKNEFLNRRIFELKNHLKKDSQEDNFFTHFERVNPSALKSLKEKHSDLTSNDLRYLSY
ncbi:tetratricopeptide repeat protein, partial [Aequorivita antarctica]